MLQSKAHEWSGITDIATHVRKAPHAQPKICFALYSKHHAVYVAGVNGALSKHPEFSKLDIVAVLKQTKDLPSDIKTAARNHGGIAPADRVADAVYCDVC